MESSQSASIHDYSVDRVPEAHRTWHWLSVSNVLAGIATAMFFMAYGGELSAKYGVMVTIVSMIVGTIIIGFAAYLFSVLGARHGLSSNLLCRELYGRYGSAIATFIYAFNYLMFFAFEGAILLTAVTGFFPAFPKAYIDTIVTVIMILLAIYGMKFMTIFMWLSLPIYVAGLILLFLWMPGLGTLPVGAWATSGHGFTLGSFGAAFATVFALISEATQGADIGRMLRARDVQKGSLALGFGTMFLTFCIVTLLGSYIGVSLGESNPGKYFFAGVGAFGVFVVFITQIRINVVNMYSGSLAYSNSLRMINVFGRAGIRPACAAVVAIAGMFLIVSGIYNHMLEVLTVEGMFIMSWGASIISYYYFAVPHRNSEPTIAVEKLRPFEPIGVIALVVSLAISLPLEFGAAGHVPHLLAPYINVLVALLLPWALHRSIPALRAVERGA
jgi:purine-cytosine permease-like protein